MRRGRREDTIPAAPDVEGDAFYATLAASPGKLQLWRGNFHQCDARGRLSLHPARKADATMARRVVAMGEDLAALRGLKELDDGAA